MAGVKGVNSFLILRYIVFGLFTICNAVTCSIAVWNSSLVRFTQPLQVDIYLIFLSAFSLLLIFTLIFVELLCINAVTTRVWFEFAWVALFWVIELAGGAALIAINSEIPCSAQGTVLREAVCTSERVLLTFVWMCTTILLIYLLTLVFLVTSRHHEGTKIWVTDVRALRVMALRQNPPPPSTPNSPLTSGLKKRASIDIYTPQPVRSYPVRAFYHRGGISSEYEIEPFRPVLAGPEQMDIPHASNLPEAIPLPPLAAAPIIPPLFMKPMPALPKDTGNVHSLMRSQFDSPQTLVSSIAYSSPAGPPLVPSKSSSLPSPPLLGDWPRQDVMQLPVKPKPRRQSPPPSAFEFPKRYMVTTERASVPTDTVTQPRPRRPSGPRLRIPSVESVHRPAPLDLSGISNYEIGRC